MGTAAFRQFAALMRLDKPVGIWLVFFPAAWGVLFASPTVRWDLLAVMLAGAAVIRAAGCILNDLADRELDRKVERTRHRPLASGAIPVMHAYALLALLLFLGLLIALSLPRPVLYVAVLAVPMIAAYPWMKRITYWPQLFLGLTFNLGAIMGWLATGAPFSPATLTLYFACILWTLAYDTIYAIQDMADDAKAGIKSSARRLGEKNIPPFVTGCFIWMLGLLLLTGFLCGARMFFLAGLAAVAAHMRWQARQLPVPQPAAGKLFASNQWLGLILTVLLTADRLFYL